MKILIVQLGRIGDMILATPMFSAIKNIYPDAEIYVLASGVNNSIIRNNPNVDKIYVLDKAPHKLLALLLQIRSNFFDYLIDPKDHCSTESSIIARLTGAKTKIGYNPPGKHYFDISNDNEKQNEGLHFVMRCFKPLLHLNIEMPRVIPRPELYPTDASRNYVKEFLRKAKGREVLVINISASYRAKMWDNDKWVGFIQAIDSGKFFPILSYAPADRDVADDLLGKVKIERFKSRSMDDVIAIIEKADILVTPDTSLVHVAAAFDKPLFGLFSGLDNFFDKFHPLSSVYEVVRSPKGMEGLKAIGIEDAITGFERLLQKF